MGARRIGSKAERAVLCAKASSPGVTQQAITVFTYATMETLSVARNAKHLAGVPWVPGLACPYKELLNTIAAPMFPPFQRLKPPLNASEGVGTWFVRGDKREAIDMPLRIAFSDAKLVRAGEFHHAHPLWYSR